MSAPAHEDRVVWAVNVALALAPGRDGRGCLTLRATARLVPDMLLLWFGRLESYRWWLSKWVVFWRSLVNPLDTGDLVHPLGHKSCALTDWVKRCLRVGHTVRC